MNIEEYTNKIQEKIGKEEAGKIADDLANILINDNSLKESLNNKDKEIENRCRKVANKHQKVFEEKLGFSSCSVSSFEQYTLAEFLQKGKYFQVRLQYAECQSPNSLLLFHRTPDKYPSDFVNSHSNGT